MLDVLAPKNFFHIYLFTILLENLNFEFHDLFRILNEELKKSNIICPQRLNEEEVVLEDLDSSVVMI